MSSIFAPQNRERVERAIREELVRAVRDGFSDAKRSRPPRTRCSRRDASRARRTAHSPSRLSHYLFVKRTFAWDIDFEKKIAALTPAQVNAALRRHIDPARLSVVVAGDLKKN